MKRVAKPTLLRKAQKNPKSDLVSSPLLLVTILFMASSECIDHLDGAGYYSLGVFCADEGCGGEDGG